MWTEVWADEMVEEGYYTRPSDPVGVYFTLYEHGRDSLRMSMEKEKDRSDKRGASACFWLSKLRREPERIPVSVHIRWLDEEGSPRESTSSAFVDPTMELRRVRQPPPHPSRYPCWCCHARREDAEAEEAEEA